MKRVCYRSGESDFRDYLQEAQMHQGFYDYMSSQGIMFHKDFTWIWLGSFGHNFHVNDKLANMQADPENDDFSAFVSESEDEQEDPRENISTWCNFFQTRPMPWSNMLRIVIVKLIHCTTRSTTTLFCCCDFPEVHFILRKGQSIMRSDQALVPGHTCTIKSSPEKYLFCILNR